VLSRGAISKLAERLLEKSLIKREADIEDRRAHSLALNEAGRSLVPRLATLADQNEAEFFGILDADERQRLERLLQRIVRERELTNIPTG
jgi:DNA-binding MarR family transcriptional regulator